MRLVNNPSFLSYAIDTELPIIASEDLKSTSSEEVGTCWRGSPTLYIEIASISFSLKKLTIFKYSSIDNNLFLIVTELNPFQFLFTYAVLYSEDVIVGTDV